MIDQSHIGLLTIAEAAEVAGVAQGTVRSWIPRYGLPTVSGIDGRILVSDEHSQLPFMIDPITGYIEDE